MYRSTYASTCLALGNHGTSSADRWCWGHWVHAGIAGEGHGTFRARARKVSVVVLTQPVQQVLGASKFGLRGSFLKDTLPEVMENLKKVEYSARFAVAYFFDKSKVSWPFPWTVKYFDKGGWAVSAYDAWGISLFFGAKEDQTFATFYENMKPSLTLGSRMPSRYLHDRFESIAVNHTDWLSARRCSIRSTWYSQTRWCQRWAYDGSAGAQWSAFGNEVGRWGGLLDEVVAKTRGLS